MLYKTAYIIFSSLFLFSSINELSAQRRYGQVRMSKARSQVACPVFKHSEYPYHGIGIKVGDPFAFSYKYYATKNFSVVIDAGKMASGLYSKYYRDNFEGLINTDTLGEGQGVSYLGHVVRQDWMVEGKLLFQQDAGKFLRGLHWYAGVGVQWRSTNIKYEYLEQLSYDRSEIQIVGNAYQTMGGVVAFGFEYAYFTIPIAAFMEIEWYTDVMQDPGWSKFQGGVGIRLIF